MRIILYSLLTFIALGVLAAGALVVAALQPEPGANMALMGLPMIALPLLVAGSLLALVARLGGERLGPRERAAAYLVAAATVGPFALLFVLG